MFNQTLLYIRDVFFSSYFRIFFIFWNLDLSNYISIVAVFKGYNTHPGFLVSSDGIIHMVLYF